MESNQKSGIDALATGEALYALSFVRARTNARSSAVKAI